MTEETETTCYTWIESYKEIAKHIKKKIDEKKSNYDEVEKYLIDIIKNYNLKNPNQKIIKNEQEVAITTNIDPFSFFCLFNRDVKDRKKFIDFTLTEMKITTILINDFYGIPIMQNTNPFFFGKYKDVAQKKNIKTDKVAPGKVLVLEYDDDNHKKDLWKLFDLFMTDNCENNEYFTNLFNKVTDKDKDEDKKTKGYNNCSNNITQAFFWFKPDEYFSLDSKMKSILNLFTDKKDTEISKLKWEGYVEIKNEINKKLEKLLNDENLKSISEQLNFNKETKFAYMSHLAWNKNSLEVLSKKNVIYYGAPGTGKTFGVNQLIIDLSIALNGKIHTKKIQFHPSFTYDDFIEGIKPTGVDFKGNIQLKLVDGIFKEFCYEASKNPDEYYFFIVDEINRANLSSVFGECLSLLESDYRIKKETLEKINKNQSIELKEFLESFTLTQYSKLNTKDNKVIYEKDNQVYFGIPENIYFIGMMNDVDKSIDAFDLALRRRFTWIEKEYDKDVITSMYKDAAGIDNYVKRIDNLNLFISKTLNLGRSYQFGHSFFLKMKSDELNKKTALEDLFNSTLKPTLREYLRSVVDENQIGPKLEDALHIFSPESTPKEKPKKNEQNAGTVNVETTTEI